MWVCRNWFNALSVAKRRLMVAMGDVGVYIPDDDGCGRMVCPGKEELEVTGVVTVSAAVRVFTLQPAGKFGDLLVHCYLLVIDFGNSTTKGNFAERATHKAQKG
jgi:hypothetical protein